MGDLRGHRSVYAAGFLVFLLGSALCGLSPSVAFLIGARGVQAIGAAMLMANAPAILTKSFPAEMRGRALGLQATMTYLGLTVGPSIGGWLATALGWRWVFYINLPVGLAALLLALRFVPRDSGSGARQVFDLRGAVTFALGLVALLLALNQGHAWGWTSPATIGLLAASVVLLLAFLRIERRCRRRCSTCRCSVSARSRLRPGAPCSTTSACTRCSSCCRSTCSRRAG